MSLANINAFLEAIDPATFYVASCGSGAPREADILAFEATCGFRLPDDFRAFTMSPFGGLHIEVQEELWPRPRLHQVMPFWMTLFGVKVFGFAPDIPPWLDLGAQYREFQEAGYLGLVPFLKVTNDPARYCFDSQGRILRWTQADAGHPEVLPGSFSDRCLEELQELRQRAADMAEELVKRAARKAQRGKRPGPE